MSKSVGNRLSDTSLKVFFCLIALSLGSLASEFPDLKVKADKGKVTKNGNFKNVNVYPYGDLVLNNFSPYPSTIIGSFKIDNGTANLTNTLKLKGNKPSKITNKAVASFLNCSLQNHFIVDQDSKITFSDKSMVEMLTLNNSTATFSGGSYLYKALTMDNHSTLTINNTDSHNLCFFQSIVLNDESSVTFSGKGGAWPHKVYDSISEGIKVNNSGTQLRWIIESASDLKTPIIPCLAEMPIKVSDNAKEYNAIISYVQSYKDKNKKTDFSKLLEVFNQDSENGIAIAKLTPGSKPPAIFFLEALTDYTEDVSTHALEYKIKRIDFNTPIEDDQGKWYRLGYKTSDNLLNLYLTLDELKDAFIILNDKGYFITPPIKAGTIFEKIEVKSQGDLEIKDCSISDLLIIEGGRANLTNITLAGNSTANDKKVDLLKGSKASFSNSYLYCLCHLDNAKAIFAVNSYVNSLTLSHSSISLFDKSLVGSLLMQNSKATCFSGSSVWQQPTVLTGHSNLTINSGLNNVGFFRSIVLNDSSHVSFHGSEGAWPNSRGQQQTEGINVNSSDAQVEWIFESMADTKLTKSKPNIPSIMDLPIKLYDSTRGYKATFSYIQSYKDSYKKTDFSKLLKLFKAHSNTGLLLAKLSPDSQLPTQFVLQALTDYAEDAFDHTFSYKICPMDFNTPVKDDQGKFYKFGYKTTLLPPAIYLTIEEKR